MILNNIRLALRGLFRDHTYSFINIGGLALGIAASIILTMWVQDELSFDSFHHQASHIYRVNANFENNGKKMTWDTPAPIAVFAKAEIPAVEVSGRYVRNEGTFLFTYGSVKSPESDNGIYADPNFFAVFDFRLIKGDPKRPFADNKSILLTESMARKYFDKEDPIGKVLSIDKDDYKVGGIVQNVPANSSIQFSFILPLDILVKNFQPNDYWKSMDTDWGNYYFFTYILLDEKADPLHVAAQLTAIHHKNQVESGVQYSLQPLEQLHLYSKDGSEEGAKTVRIFMIVAFSILLIACINYINLSTARATKRAKEVGIRKTVGASRARLIAQFLTESVIISILAICLSMVVIQLVIPFYNDLSGKNFAFSLINPQSLWMLGAVLVITGLVAGIYPAWVLSSFQPMNIIRGKLGVGGGNSTFRKALVIIQFTLSIAIIISTMVIGQQLSFMRNQALGFDKANIFAFGLRGDMFKNKDAIKNELAKQQGVSEVSLANNNIISIGSTTGDTDWENKPKEQGMMVKPLNVDHNFIGMMNVQILDGRGFNGTKSDSTSFVLNEAAVKETGLIEPVGKSFTLWQTKGTIIGVIKDFHHSSMHNRIEPTVFYNQPGGLWLMYVKTNGKDNPGAIAAAGKIWKQYNADYPFDYNFIDASYDKMYKTEQRLEKLFSAFAAISILISCLGLFALATFTAVQRTKEIGIRKVMGSSVSQIVLLLSKDFLLLILVAFACAIPISWLAMSSWLKDFAYKIDLSWITFAVAGGLALLIAFLTISFQTFRAATGDPVKAIRTE